MAEIKITENRTLVSVESGKGWWGRLMRFNNPDRAFEYMLITRDSLEAKLTDLEIKRSLITSEFPEKFHKLYEEEADVRERYKTAQLELLFLFGERFGGDKISRLLRGER